MKLKNDGAKLNPCLKEQEQTFKCFFDNDFNKETCALHIQNYRVCKEFWTAVRRDRRRRGIKPELPPEEERAEVKEEFLNRFK